MLLLYLISTLAHRDWSATLCHVTDARLSVLLWNWTLLNWNRILHSSIGTLEGGSELLNSVSLPQYLACRSRHGKQVDLCHRPLLWFMHMTIPLLWVYSLVANLKVHGLACFLVFSPTGDQRHNLSPEMRLVSSDSLYLDVIFELNHLILCHIAGSNWLHRYWVVLIASWMLSKKIINLGGGELLTFQPGGIRKARLA